ncbi:MAG: DUF2442 domain-containing protein [Bacteroides sp.]|nr:DUF2442 domain-containing protein [Prevotella sp.]MCM1406986.1 DUF2442 domain-containing protein [Treponema brennaborense]MCM1470137.1 DUF2442 domain-containing protein [Bacteroides sp.]
MNTVIQVIPKKNYKVAVYFSDGAIKECDVSHLVGRGVFDVLKDEDFYRNNCTVLNHTLAWTLDGKYDGANCLDLDAEVLYKNGAPIQDPLEEIA